MKIKILIGVLAFLILVNLATIGSFLVMLKRGKAPDSFRHDFSKRHIETPFDRERPMRRMNRELRDQLRDDFHKLHEDTRDLRADIHDLEAETFALMQMDPFPAERVDSLLQEISRTRLEISRMATRNMIEARSKLTPEERKLFFDALLGSRPDVPGPPDLPHRSMNKSDRRHKMHKQRNRPSHSDSLSQEQLP